MELISPLIEALTFFWFLFRDVCLPIVVLISIGIILDKKYNLDLATLVKLNIHIFVPGFIFVKVVESSTRETELQGTSVVFFTLSVIAATFVIGFLITVWQNWEPSKSRSFFLSTMFYNCGNWGIPMMALAYPENGASIHIYALLTMNLSTFTIGMFLASGYGSKKPFAEIVLGLFKLTPVYAISLGIICIKFQIPVADWKYIWAPLQYIDRGLVSIALVTLGVQLSKTSPPKVDKFIGLALLLRLVVGPLIALGLTVFWKLPHSIAAILILGAGAPTAVNTALLAHDLKADSRYAAAVVFYSTCIAIFTVTAILTIQRLFVTPE